MFSPRTGATCAISSWSDGLWVTASQHLFKRQQLEVRRREATCLRPHSLEVREARLVFRQPPAQDELRPYPGICCAPPRCLPCPCQAARANGCSVKILISESGPIKSWHRAAECPSARTKVHPQLLPACVGGDRLPGHRVLARGGPTAAPRSPGSRAGPRLPVL